MVKKKLRCYLYTRVSTEMQIDGYSLDAQKDVLTREANHRGMMIVGEYSDEGCSGKNIAGRPQFQQMMNDIQSEKDGIDYVLVFKLSRFGRNTADIMNSLQFMEDYGVNLLCVSDNIDSGSGAGKLMISVLSAVAEIERENIREQTMAGREQKAKSGKWNGGFAPYGYKLEYQNGEKVGSLVINEDEAPLIREIYKRYQKMGLAKVAKSLNDEGYRKILRQNGSVEGISAHFVKLVIDNPVYMGKIAYGRRRNEKIKGSHNEYHIVKQSKDSYKLHEGEHEAIIDEETWYKCQKKREVNAFKREKIYSKDHAHILSSVVKCPICGSSMYGNINRKKKADGSYYKDIWYYVCKHRKMVDGYFCKYTRQIRQDELNEEVFALIRWVWSDTEFRDDIMSRFGQEDELVELQAQYDRLKTEKDKLANKRTKIGAKIKSLDIDDARYDVKFDMIMSQIDSIEDEIAEIESKLINKKIAIENAKNNGVSYDLFKFVMEYMLEHIEYFDEETLRDWMQKLIERIDIFPEKQSDGRWVKSIKFKIPINYNGYQYDRVFFDRDSIEGTPDGVLLMVDSCEDSFTPQEKHDETVVLLSKGEIDSKKVRVEFSLEDMDMSGFQSDATYGQIKERVLEQTGLKVSSLYIAQIKQKYGIIERENYNKAKSENAKQPKCPPEKEEAITAALKYFQMI